jgi:hypothetical protein
MPAHIGIADKLKVPLASLIMKAVKLRYVFDQDNIRRPDDTSMKKLNDRLEQIRSNRERRFDGYATFRQIVDMYKPDASSSDEIKHDWAANLAPGAYIDELIKLSFELDTIKYGIFITRKSAMALKRLEVYRDNGSMEIAWSHG